MKKAVNIVFLLSIMFIMSMVISGDDIANANEVVDTTGDTYSGTVLVAINGCYDDEYYINGLNQRVKAEKVNSVPGILTSGNNTVLKPANTAGELNNGKIQKVDKELISPEPVGTQDSILQSSPAISGTNEYSVNDTMTLYTDNKGNLYTIDMICLYIGTYCTVWGANGLDTDTIDINVLIAEQIASEFDSKFLLMTSSFGSYWYDADGDGKIAIMCYDIDSEKSEDSLGTSYTSGYFWMRDMIDMNGYVNASGPNGAVNYGLVYFTNGIDCIHIDTYPTMGSAGNYLSDIPNSYGTLIHEFQHMINYSYQVQNGGAGYFRAMEVYLNEAFSMGAEQFIYGADSVSGMINHYNNITGKLTYGSPLTYWENTPDNYSLSYLFGQYIRTQYGLKQGFGNNGSGIYNYVLNNRNPGNEEDTLGIIAGVLGVSKEELICDFWVALYKKDDTGVYGFAGETAFDNVTPDIKALTDNDTVYNGGAMYYYIGGSAASEGNVTPGAYSKYSRFASIGYAPTLSDINGAKSSETSGRFMFTSEEAGTIYYMESGTAITDKNVITSTQVMTAGANTVSLTITSPATAVYYYAKDSAGNETGISVITLQAFTPPVISDPVGTRNDETSGRFTFISDEEGTIYYAVSGTAITDKSLITPYLTMTAGANTVSLTLTSPATAVYYYAKDGSGYETDIYSVSIPAYAAPVIKYKLNVTSGPGGVIDLNASGYYKEGQKIAVSCSPEIGYVFDSWISSDGGYFNAPENMVTEFTMPGNDTAITATFDFSYFMFYTAVNYNIVSSADGSGKISPSGIVPVNNGSNMTFAFIPDTGYKLYDVLVDNISIGAVNNYTFTNAGAGHTIKAIFIDDNFPLDPVYDWPFDDVFENDSAVKFVYENNLFKGITPDKFGPGFNMTRAMFVTVLGRLAKIDMADYTGAGYTDVNEEQWYSASVEWASQNGIVSGYGNGLFGPNDLITFEQAAQILFSYAKWAGYDVSNTDDTLLAGYKESSNVDLWAKDAMLWAVNNSLITVTPLTLITRVQTAQMIKAFCNTFIN